jgi:chemotaxis-related protein WspB
MTSMLLFYVDLNRYAVENQYVAYIVPAMYFKLIVTTEPFIKGVIDLDGQIIPIIDFCELVAHHPASSALHTRIILLQRDKEIIGLLAERITQIIEVDVSRWKPLPLTHLPYIDQVYTDAKGMIQRINVIQLMKYLESYITYDSI